MSSKLLRRIGKELKALRASPPADYFFCDSASSHQNLTNDITTIEIFMLGPVATPYENGVFRLRLKVSEQYPNEPPVVTFKTKIFHANIQESNGDVCVDTLKSGWTSDLTLNDVLVTIRCLLIHPNPASALNSEAASLAERCYRAFEKYAQMLTKIHASPSPELKQAVKEARAARKDSPPDGNDNEEAMMQDTTDADAASPSSSPEQPAKTDPVSPKESGSEGKGKGKSESAKVTDGDLDEAGKENSRSGPANTSNTPSSSISTISTSTSTSTSTATSTSSASSSFITPKKRSFDEIPSNPQNNNDSKNINEDDISTPLPKRVLRSNTKASLSPAGAAGASPVIASKKRVPGQRPGGVKGRMVSGASTRSVSSSSSRKASDPKRGLKRL